MFYQNNELINKKSQKRDSYRRKCYVYLCHRQGEDRQEFDEPSDYFQLQNSIPAGCVLPTFSDFGRGVCPPPRYRLPTPGCRPPQMQTPRPLDADSQPLDAEASPQEANPPTSPVGISPPTSVNRMTDASENITLLQTWFAGGNKRAFSINKLSPFGLNLASHGFTLKGL